MKKRVLFLCTGNSCRSHMAEGLTNYYLADTWEAVSAGTQPSGYVHPLAIAVLAFLLLFVAKRGMALTLGVAALAGVVAHLVM